VAARKRRKSRRAKRGFHISPKCLAPIHYRSGWELKYALYLDANPLIASYRYEPYSIPYVSNTRTRRIRQYWPDFELVQSSGLRVLVEVKPLKKLKQAINRKKMEAAKRFCATNGLAYGIITEVDLKELGLL
jgi:hypothetical protein